MRLPGRGRHRLRQIRLNGWNKPFYDALSRRDLHDFLPARRVLRHRRHRCWSERGAALAREMLKLKLREGLVQRSAARLDAAAPRVLARQRGRSDGRQSRPAHARGCAQAVRALGRPGHRPAAGLDSVRALSPACSGGCRNDFAFRIGDDDYAVPGFMVWAADRSMRASARC